MRNIVSIVEGHGEEEAVPILLRRIAGLVSPDFMVDVPRPIRIGRQKLLKDGEVVLSVAWVAGALAAELLVASDG